MKECLHILRRFVPPYKKYLALNIDYPMKDVSPLTDEGIADIAGVFAQHFDTTIEQ